jgi:hypothetical protein
MDTPHPRQQAQAGVGGDDLPLGIPRHQAVLRLCGWTTSRPTCTRSPARRTLGGAGKESSSPRTWWAEHHVNSASYGTKRYQHPTVGYLTLDCDTWDSPDGSGQRRTVLLTAYTGRDRTENPA